MNAILTKYLPATNTKGARIKATCERGNLTVGYYDVPTGANESDTFAAVARLLCERFAQEDYKCNGQPIDSNPWLRPFVTGAMPHKMAYGYVHVFAS